MPYGHARRKRVKTHETGKDNYLGCIEIPELDDVFTQRINVQNIFSAFLTELKFSFNINRKYIKSTFINTSFRFLNPQ